MDKLIGALAALLVMMLFLAVVFGAAFMAGIGWHLGAGLVI